MPGRLDGARHQQPDQQRDARRQRRQLHVVGDGENWGLGAEVYDVRLLHAGKFQIPRIGEGSYTLSAFRDDDNNGKYSYGKPFPFQPSELFAFYPDTVKVRARWPVEGIVIRLK